MADSGERLGESQVIALLARGQPVPPGWLGPGDDCAFLPGPGRGLLLTVDLLVEGVHFRREWLPPRELGWKALAANLSDLAAAGARPLGALLGLGLPAGTRRAELEELRRGLDDCARACVPGSLPLLGGDTVEAPALTLSLTLLGEPWERPLLRSGARTGHGLYVSRPLGDAAAGLELLEHPRPGLPPRLVEPLLRAHRRPWPELELGRALAELAGDEPPAVMDLSDGLLLDLRRLCEASGVAALLELDAVPTSPELRELAGRLGRDPLEWALGGGEDYALLVSAPPALAAALEERGFGLHRLGRVVEGRGLRCLRAGRPVDCPEGGWEHGF